MLGVTKTVQSKTPASKHCQYNGWLQLSVSETHRCFRIDANGVVFYQGKKLSPSLPAMKPPSFGGQPNRLRISSLDPSGRYAIASTRRHQNSYFIFDLQEQDILEYAPNKKHVYLPQWVKWPRNSKYALLYEDGAFSDGRGAESIDRIDLETGEVKSPDFSALIQPQETIRIAANDFVWQPDGQHFRVSLTICKDFAFECEQTGSAEVEIDIEHMTPTVLSKRRNSSEALAVNSLQKH